MATNWQHQDDALMFLHNREGTSNGSMLAMEPGTGKSRVAIQYAEDLDCASVLVLCPKAVIDVWNAPTRARQPGQFQQHGTVDWYVHSVDGNKSVRERQNQAANRMALALDMHRPFALIVNYEAAWREPFASWIMSQRWDLLILDESHKIKSPGGKASRFVSRLKSHTLKRLAMSGTPMAHSPLDLYAQWRALDTSVFGTSYQRFVNHYADKEERTRLDGKKYVMVVRLRNLDDLITRAGAGTFVVKKRDVLDLPPVVHEEIPVILSSATMRHYREFKKELVLEFGTGVLTATNSLTKLLRLQQITSGFVTLDDGSKMKIGTEKREALSDKLDEIPPGEPVVVFCRFLHDLDAVHGVSKVIGRQSFELSGRVNSLAVWQNMDGGQVLAVQIQSGGLGIDLTRASYAMYYSKGYSLGDYQQSHDRLDRYGQTAPVTFYHLVAQDTVDEDVETAIEAKGNVVETVTRGLSK